MGSELQGHRCGGEQGRPAQFVLQDIVTNEFTSGVVCYLPQHHLVWRTCGMSCKGDSDVIETHEKDFVGCVVIAGSSYNCNLSIRAHDWT